jgi:hypothetical protein
MRNPTHIQHVPFRVSRFMFRVSPLLLTACAQQPLHPAPSASPFIQGHAKVLEVHNELGYALLDIDGKHLYGYWDTDPASGQTSTITTPGQWQETTGEGKPPIVHHQNFPAKVGDTIAFRGLMTGPDLLLRGVAVMSK